MKLDLLTNVTVVEYAIRFVEKPKQSANLTRKEEKGELEEENKQLKKDPAIILMEV